MPRRKKILVDVDSTLYDADALFYKVAVDEGHDWYPKKSYSWFRADHLGISQSVMTNLFRKAHSREYVNETLKPYKDAVNVLTEFDEIWGDQFKLCYVSSRHPQMEGTLLEWISYWDFPLDNPDDVIATMDKKSWIKENRPTIVIDDRVQTIIFSRFEIGATVLSLIHNHNVNLTNEVDDVYMCENWPEIGLRLNEVAARKVNVKSTANV
jgi:hypothetical protein